MVINMINSLDEEKVTFSDPLTLFLYQLIKDVPCGMIESIIQNVIVEGNNEIIFANGYLAKYANNLAELIKGANKKNNTRAGPDNVVPFTVEKNKINNNTLKQLELDRVSNNIEEGKLTPDELKMTTVDDAKDIVRKLQKTGGLSKEEAIRISNELESVRGEIEERQKIEAQEIKDEKIDIIINNESDSSMEEVNKILDELIDKK